MDDNQQSQEEHQEDLSIDIHYQEHEVIEYIAGYEKVWKFEG